MADKIAVGRRELLKLGAAAAGLGTLHLVVPRGARALGSEPGTDSYGLSVVIQDAPVASANVHSLLIDDLTVDAQPLNRAEERVAAAHREMTSGADWDYRVYGPGDAHYGSVAVRARVGRGLPSELEGWFESAAAGACTPKDITISIVDQSGERTFNLFECYPVAYAPHNLVMDPSGTSAVACETVVAKMGRVELA
jgi:hypothetical protein